MASPIRARLTATIVLALGLSLALPAVTGGEAQARTWPHAEAHKRKKQKRHKKARRAHRRSVRYAPQGHRRVRPRLRRKWSPPVVRRHGPPGYRGPRVRVRPRRRVAWAPRRVVLPPPVYLVQEPVVIVETPPARRFRAPAPAPRTNHAPQTRPEAPAPPEQPPVEQPPVEYDAPDDDSALPPTYADEQSEGDRGQNATTLTEQEAVALEAEIHRLINDERRKAGVPPLQMQANLTDAAVGHSTEMFTLGYFSHTSPTADRQKFTDRIRLAGVKKYGAAGENIAMTTAPGGLAERFVKMWMDSPGHRRNILDPTYTLTGVGVFGDGSAVYATQLFGNNIEAATVDGSI